MPSMPPMPPMPSEYDATHPVGKNLECHVGDFAVRCLAVCEALPRGKIGVSNLRDQLSRAATSVAANYAEATVPSSRRDFANKMTIAMRELVESRMWLYVISRRGYIKPHKLMPLFTETNELVRIFGASISTARKRLANEIKLQSNGSKEEIHDDNDGIDGQ